MFDVEIKDILRRLDYVQDASETRIYIIPFFQSTKTIPSFQVAGSPIVAIPAVTNNGLASLLPISNRGQFEHLQHMVLERMRLKDPEEKCVSWVCAVIMHGYDGKGTMLYLNEGRTGDIVSFLDVHGSTKRNQELERLYSSLIPQDICCWGSGDIGKTLQAYRKEPKWINTLILHFQIQWNEYIKHVLWELKK